MANPQTGRIHSLETFGAADGPGIRYLVFFQGCPLRCVFCHNPDSWSLSDGSEMSADEIVSKILPYRAFYRKGGVTLTGGEPLAQPEFAAALLRQLKTVGLHTAIDTAGSIPLERCREAVELADLILLDIKAMDPALCRAMTGFDGAGAKRLLEYRQSKGLPVWIRHVLVPGYTLEDHALHTMAEYLSAFSCVQRVDLLPFHQLGRHKWKLLGIPYPLEDAPTPDARDVERAADIFRSYGLPVS